MSAVLSEQPEPTTSVEEVIAAATAPGCIAEARTPTLAGTGAGPRAASRGPQRPPGRPGSTPPAELRARLLPGRPAARAPRADGPAHRTPATAVERIAVLRASDRSVVLECADEDRGAVPVAEPSVVVRRLALAAVEVIIGLRPAAQLARWLTPGVLQALRTRADLGRRAGIDAARPVAGARPPAVRRAHVCPVEPHIVEAAVVVDDGCRVRAVAVRLETHRGVWRATALDVG